MTASTNHPVSHPVQILPPEIARWSDSNCGTPYVHERSANASGPDVLVTALVHGNEYAGAIALSELLASRWCPARGRVTFAFCNVVAFARFDAQNPDASRFVDEDFNRVWSPARLNSSAQSTELTRARQIRPFVDRATHLLDLHSMHEPAPPWWVTGLLSRNIAFAQSLQMPVQVVVDPGHQDGVRMRDQGEFGSSVSDRIALLLEAGQHWQASSVSVVKNSVMRFLRLAKAVTSAEIPAGWLMPDCAPPAPVWVTDRVVARSKDFVFTYPFTGGETIAQKGTVIAMDGGEPIETPYDDCVLVMPSVRQLYPGVTTVRLGRVVGIPPP